MSKSSENKIKNYGSLTPYIIGFILSLLLTFASYYLVEYRLIENNLLIIFLLFLAFIQLLVQLFCFLHLGQEKNPRWNLIFFISTAGIVILIVIASIWIMENLNYNMMPSEMDELIMDKENIYK